MTTPELIPLVVEWFASTGAVSHALVFSLLGFTFGVAVVFVSVLAMIAVTPFTYIIAVYLFDLRKKNITDV